jgi:lipopolysaccharide/colanic/teichoic acid biosynthesis glycosyltransferase
MRAFNLTWQHAPHRGASIQEVVIRAFEILAAAFGLIVLGPLMLLIVAAIVLEGGLPVFFSQRRLGQGGTPFSLYKFRKFRADAGGGAVTVQDDPRLTCVGRVLERTKLDELPQLWNVLRGDMSLVGPRPESVAFADCFRGEFRQILAHRPGLFGPSQTLFRNECAMYPDRCDPEAHYRAVLFPAKARIDLDYYGSRTVWGDMKWLLRSIAATVCQVRLEHADWSLAATAPTETNLSPKT